MLEHELDALVLETSSGLACDRGRECAEYGHPPPCPLSTIVGEGKMKRENEKEKAKDLEKEKAKEKAEDLEKEKAKEKAKDRKKEKAKEKEISSKTLFPSGPAGTVANFLQAVSQNIPSSSFQGRMDSKAASEPSSSSAALEPSSAASSAALEPPSAASPAALEPSSAASSGGKGQPGKPGPPGKPGTRRKRPRGGQGNANV